MSPPRLLLVGGSDSSGGAGLAADLTAAAAQQVHGLLAVTAVTAQDAGGLHGSWPVPAAVLAAQLAAGLALDPALVKTGMLAGAAAVEQVAELPRPLVVDPVLAASSGAPLLDPAGLALLRGRLIPRTLVLTPNRPEARALTGAREPDLLAALLDLGARWVLLTGGHLAGEPVDLLAGADGSYLELPGRRVPTRYDRGTGCLLATTLAARLALGDDVPAAALAAKKAVSAALAASYPLAPGYGVPRRWPAPAG